VTTYTLRKGSPATTRTDVVVIGVGRDRKGHLIAASGAEEVAEAYGRRFEPLLRSLGFGGRPGDSLRVPTNGTVRAATLVAVGLGDLADLTEDAVRRAAGVAARQLENAATVAVALPAPDAAHVRAVVEGFRSGGYRYAGHRSTPAASEPADVVVLSEAARRQDAIAAAETAGLVEDLADRVRTWVNEPPNELTPDRFAEEVLALGRERGKAAPVRAEVWDVAGLVELGCGGILAVGNGSAHPPVLVRLIWSHAEPVATVALVGKGVTYDSGGLTIKPGGSMATMKYDMDGAGAVVAATHAIAALDLPVALTTYVPMAENMISGSAMRPGDVLQTYGGKTVEVTNTDAEGRLLLADALGMAVEGEPDVILEISTLTGPCVTALGDRIAGLFGDGDPVARVEEAARRRGELVWPMPVPERIEEQVRSDSRVADVLQHNWVRWGSASYAAAFLRQFTGAVPFAHLDIAGPAWNAGAAWGQVPTGGTGFGVRTLVETVAGLTGRS
jgi:leucyl aminopeptidase